MKKIIALLLVIASVISCFVFTVSADDVIITDEAYLPFEDIKENHWFFESVEFCYANEIIKGMNDYTFVWSGELTRAQFVQMLATVDDADLTRYQVSEFDDVKSDHWYYGAVAWAYETGLTSGVSAVKFAPNDPVTRAEISRFMMKYMENKYSVEVDYRLLDVFTDKPKTGTWFYEGIAYAVSAGLISGMEMDGKLCVNTGGKTTRAQAAVIFKNFMENYFCGGCQHEFSEADCTNAETCEKCGLANGLANGHRVTAYNCITPAFCLDCGSAVAASILIHEFADATCIAPRTCTLCGVTRGEAKGHKWNAATCTVPKTCTVCNATEGTPISHKGMNDICKYCGGEFFDSFYDKAIYYIRQNGEYDAETNAYTVGSVNEYGGTTVSYYENEKLFAINNFYFYEDGYVDLTQIQLRGGYNVYDYHYILGNEERDIFHGFGRLDARTINSNTKESFSSYQGEFDSTYTDNLNIALQAMLGDASDLFSRYCKVSLKDFGFKAY